MALVLDDQGKKALKVVGAIVLIATILFSVSCGYFNKEMNLPNDNPIEQTAEAAIDAAFLYETGVNPKIDLTPEDDDNPNKVYPVAEE